MEALNLAFVDGLLNLTNYWVVIFLAWVQWWVMLCGWFEGL